jgi:hypothetical protein
MSDPGGIHPSFVPAVQDLQIFIPLISINEGPGSFFPLVSSITFHGNFLKNPFHKDSFRLSAVSFQSKTILAISGRLKDQIISCSLTTES